MKIILKIKIISELILIFQENLNLKQGLLDQAFEIN